MTFDQFIWCLKADLFRYDRSEGIRAGLRRYFTEDGFRLSFWLRLTRFLRSHAFSRFGLYHLSLFFLGHTQRKLSVYINFMADIGPGIYFAHPVGIVINGKCRIGSNCSIAQHVTLGRKSREPNIGCPWIRDRVYIGPGAVIIGSIDVDSDSAIGANCVLTKSVSTGSVVVGVPGKVISTRGSEGYVTDFLDLSNSTKVDESSDLNLD